MEPKEAFTRDEIGRAGLRLRQFKEPAYSPRPKVQAQQPSLEPADSRAVVHWNHRPFYLLSAVFALRLLRGFH